MSMKPHGLPGRDPYPALLESAKREVEKIGKSRNPMLPLDGSDVQYVEVDTKAQASLRALAVAIAAMPDGLGMRSARPSVTCSTWPTTAMRGAAMKLGIARYGRGERARKDQRLAKTS
jgi:hypothetical protein